MIKFGTSGWRGIIGEDFTFENVRIASQGIANYLIKSQQKGSGMVVAYDTRFLSEKFALEAARILAFNGQWRPRPSGGDQGDRAGDSSAAGEERKNRRL